MVSSFSTTAACPSINYQITQLPNYQMRKATRQRMAFSLKPGA
jgi:hypothetical protein